MSHLVRIITISIASFVTGFLIDRYFFTGNPTIRRKTDKTIFNHPPAEESDYEEDSEDEGIDVDSSDLNKIGGEVKMTLVVRQNLKMGKGKAAAQCSHATLALYKKMTNPNSSSYNPEMIQRWEILNGQAKITLQVPDAEEMDMLFAQAISLGVNCYIVHDAGRTQIPSGSATVLGLGPAPKAVLDQITGHLKLY